MKSIAETVSNTTRPVVYPNDVIRHCWKSQIRSIALPLGMTVRIATVCLTLYWLLIFIGTHLPGGVSPRLYLNDKLLHFGAYAGLAFLLAWALPTRNDRVLLHVLIALTVVITYGCLDEISQLFIPGRHGCFSDFLADALGGLFGVAVYSACRRILMSREMGKRLVDLLSR